MTGRAIWYGGSLCLDEMNEWGEETLCQHLGIRLIDFGDDWLSGSMPVDARTKQVFGRLHGGASAALAETMASFGGSYVVDRDRFAVVGVEVNANHVRAVGIGPVLAVATAEKIGRTIQVWSVRISDPSGRLACLARVTLAVVALSDAGPR